MRLWRALLLAGIAAAALVPLALLVTWAGAPQWYYPALLPRSWGRAGWALLATADRARLGSALATSVAIGIGTGLIGTALALPIGRALARLRGWRRIVGAAAVFAPVAAPPIALGIGIQYFLLVAGLGGTSAGVLAAHLIPTVGYLTLYFLGVFTVLDARLEADARTLGASAAQAWRFVLIPVLRRQIVESIVIGFLISWAQYALTLAIGGGLVHTLPLEVFAYLRAGSGSVAAAAALVLVTPPLVAVAAMRYAARRTVVVPL